MLCNVNIYDMPLVSRTDIPPRFHRKKVLDNQFEVFLGARRLRRSRSSRWPWS